MHAWQCIIQSGVMYWKVEGGLVRSEPINKTYDDKDKWKDLYSSHKIGEMSHEQSYIFNIILRIFFFDFELFAIGSNDGEQRCRFECCRPPHNANGDLVSWKYITTFSIHTENDIDLFVVKFFLFSLGVVLSFIESCEIDSCRSCISVKLPKSMNSNVRF